MTGGPVATGFSEPQRELLRSLPERMDLLRNRLATRVIGQERTVRELLLGFLARGHVLVIGVPGLAKTLLIRSLAELFDLEFARIQFTPDLMPSDITGTSIIYRNETTGQREFRFRGGPVFTNLLLADEINRTPPKTQSALLEAMEEKQVTVGGRTQEMKQPFFVLATQNPIEQEGTYPLPVTQLDRFLFQINIDYPDPETEFEVVATTTVVEERPLEPVLSHAEIVELLSIPRLVEIPQHLVERATRLVRATRPKDQNACEATREWISWGAGPRAVQAILQSAQASALMSGRERVTEDDYEQVLLPALRHRVLLNYHAEAEFTRPDEVIVKIREQIGDRPPSDDASVERAPRKLTHYLKALGDPSPAFKKRV